jgi:hypothetical protein
MDEEPGRETAANVTSLLHAWSAGDQTVLDQLIRWYMGNLSASRDAIWCANARYTRQPSALVNETSLRLVDVHGVQWQDRAHLFALAAQMMRGILVNYALARGAGKRRGAPSLAGRSHDRVSRT